MSDLQRRLERLEHALHCPVHHVALGCPQCVPADFAATTEARAAEVRQRILDKLQVMRERMDAAKDIVPEALAPAGGE